MLRRTLGFALLLAVVPLACSSSNGTPPPNDTGLPDDAPAPDAQPDVFDATSPDVLDATQADAVDVVDASGLDRAESTDVVDAAAPPDRADAADVVALDQPAARDVTGETDGGPRCEGRTQGACPPGYTCLGFSGIVLTWFCGIPCRTDAECPSNMPRCTLRPDKSGRLYVCQ